MPAKFRTRSKSPIRLKRSYAPSTQAPPSENESVTGNAFPFTEDSAKPFGKSKQNEPPFPKASCTSLLEKTINYALGQWPKLKTCFINGRLEIDNNLIENGTRPTKLGAKNWLLMGSVEAGQSNAIWYTLIESCRRRKVDPWKYLVWIFEELPKTKVTAESFGTHTPKAYAKSLRKLRISKTA